MERRFQDNALAILVGVGVLMGVTAFGAVLAMLLGKRNQQPAQFFGFGRPQLPEPVIQATTDETPALYKPSYTSTITLSTTDISRVLNAGSNRHWRAQLRNIGPPGSIAFVSTDSNALSYPSQSASIPAGGMLEFRVRPRDALFALGNVANVQLTIAASEELA